MRRLALGGLLTVCLLTASASAQTLSGNPDTFRFSPAELQTPTGRQRLMERLHGQAAASCGVRRHILLVLARPDTRCQQQLTEAVLARIERHQTSAP